MSVIWLSGRFHGGDYGPIQDRASEVSAMLDDQESIMLVASKPSEDGYRQVFLQVPAQLAQSFPDLHQIAPSNLPPVASLLFGDIVEFEARFRPLRSRDDD